MFQRNGSTIFLTILLVSLINLSQADSKNLQSLINSYANIYQSLNKPNLPKSDSDVLEKAMDKVSRDIERYLDDNEGKLSLEDKGAIQAYLGSEEREGGPKSLFLKGPLEHELETALGKSSPSDYLKSKLAEFREYPISDDRLIRASLFFFEPLEEIALGNDLKGFQNYLKQNPVPTGQDKGEYKKQLRIRYDREIVEELNRQRLIYPEEYNRLLKYLADLEQGKKNEPNGGASVVPLTAEQKKELMDRFDQGLPLSLPQQCPLPPDTGLEKVKKDAEGKVKVAVEVEKKQPPSPSSSPSPSTSPSIAARLNHLTNYRSKVLAEKEKEQGHLKKKEKEDNAAKTQALKSKTPPQEIKEFAEAIEKALQKTVAKPITIQDFNKTWDEFERKFPKQKWADWIEIKKAIAESKRLIAIYENEIKLTDSQIAKLEKQL